MKYQYHDQRGRLLCEADSPITFNLVLYPIWKYIKCRISDDEGEVVEEKMVAERVIQTKEEKDEEVVAALIVKQKIITKKEAKKRGKK